ncbi:Zn(II)2Cys6 transcription factor domain-containing protein [Aspergillus homomorphus CBS 101889]|uniref:Zn(2)-C6 fungal-type domain-containing protein n=1 Tax=Aspergillus homomorphus (strain CBS 101889) TaxID=1450537 RepID=A0A395I7D3_ASPHC|nr:hypothetical protein BO97DRAFT_21174 [Aspergillus homomorphus CBS 101889]RAL14134.1 hypothetical protein BO97DRAFT_21174 [Aspergillus homomorphus CBS 101889]
MEISRVLNYMDDTPQWVGGRGGEGRGGEDMDTKQPKSRSSHERLSQPSSSEEPSPRPICPTPNLSSHTLIRNKKPIPRQASRGYAPKSRAALACNSCRQGKFKCTGEKNQCQRCAMLGRQCWYPAHKRERIQREMDQLVTEANEYRLMLELLLSRVNKEDAEDISSLLFKYEK